MGKKLQSRPEKGAHVAVLGPDGSGAEKVASMIGMEETLPTPKTMSTNEKKVPSLLGERFNGIHSWRRELPLRTKTHLIARIGTEGGDAIKHNSIGGR